MLFDRGFELPVATVRRAPRGWGDVLTGDLQRWLIARWRWLAPRLVPSLVALVGMFAVLQAVGYLSRAPAQPAPAIDDGAGTATMYIDGKPYQDGMQVPELPTAGYRVRVVIHQ